MTERTLTIHEQDVAKAQAYRDLKNSIEQTAIYMKKGKTWVKLYTHRAKGMPAGGQPAKSLEPVTNKFFVTKNAAVPALPFSPGMVQ